MTDTKTITFEGRSYTVPIWVEWVARDEDCNIYGYESEPRQVSDGFSSGSRYVFIEDAYDWRDSLTKV